MEKILAQYIPEEACPTIAKWINFYGAELKITKNRSTKLGDYRHPYGSEGHRISVNHNLNKFAFLVTLVHEFAHLITWEKHRNRVKPHGSEWKHWFQQAMLPFFELAIFPQDIQLALERYMNNPAASSCTDVHLQKILKRYDPVTAAKGPTIDQLPIKTQFKLGNKIFEKGERLRKRFRCVEVKTGRVYLVSPLAEVTPLRTNV